jgi:predicted GIY-YIG superfamily endonuclease
MLWHPNLEKRMFDHNLEYSKSTKDRKWTLVYYKAYVTRKADRKREYRLKHGGRSKQLLFERIKDSLE